MRATLEELSRRLDDLSVFLESSDRTNGSPNSGSSDRQYVIVRRRIDSVGFIATLYAAFEQFIENLVWTYAELQTNTMKYIDLSAGLRDKHLRISGNLLHKGRLGEGRYVGRSDAEFVANLHACLSEQNPYRMNRDAIIHHEDNLRATAVQEAFSLFGISSINELARAAEPLLQWYCRAEGRSELPEGRIPEKTIGARLLEFVQRRNQFAHGGGSWEESLGLDEMRAHLDFVRAYCEALYRIVAGEYINGRYVTSNAGAIDLGVILEGPFKNRNHAVVVAKPSFRIEKGQPIIGVRAGRVHFWGDLVELQVDTENVECVDPSTPGDTIGIVADFKPTKTTRLYVLVSKDPAIWL